MMAIGSGVYVEIKAHASRCFTDYPFCYKIRVAISRFWRDGDSVRSLAYLETKGLSATATELRARLILKPARLASRRQGRSALCATATRLRGFGRPACAEQMVPFAP